MMTECSCFLPDLFSSLTEALMYVSFSFLVLSIIIYFIEYKRKPNEKTSGSDMVRTMIMFLRDFISVGVFFLYSVFLFGCLYLALTILYSEVIPKLIYFIDNFVIPQILSDWVSRLVLLVLIPIILWIFIEGKIRTPKVIRFLLGACSPTNKFSSTVMAPLIMLSVMLFLNHQYGGGIHWVLYLSLIFILTQLLLLKEILKHDSENKLVNQFVAAANITPTALSVLILEFNVFECVC